jgi:Domain of unknown function (DUF4331)
MFLKMKNITLFSMKALAVLGLVASIAYYGNKTQYLEASSHREAPMIANDPLADNTDVYAFRSPDNPNTVTIIANYIGLELPQGGPNYTSFGEDIRYEIHIKKNAASFGDDLLYRFTFTKTNEDPTTFFNIRLGKQNLKTVYKLERRFGNNGEWATIIENGVVPPNNIGPRSIENPTLGLGKTYEQLMTAAIMTAANGNEKVFCGPVDDPFFVDLGGIFDLGQTRQAGGARDGVACTNVHAIALQIPIQLLQKDFKTISQATNILDGDYVIGVWASASRQRVTTLRNDGMKPMPSGDWVQVSRLGMPLTNEAVIPIGQKDKWNYGTPYEGEGQFEQYMSNPELALYMDDRQFGAAVPAFADLRVQTASKTVLGAVDFGNGKDGLFVIKGHPATAGTALDDKVFGNYLLRKGQPRSVDLVPIFHAGVPNVAPYQLATGKTPGNPLTAGKPFINNFLPSYMNGSDVRFGDMLRLNMAVPPTSRTDAKFSSEGLVGAAVLGLTDPLYNTTTTLQNIPNMDGFPNGRRLEDDVTRIELQAVSGVVLAAVGLWYDDWVIGQSPLTPKLLKVLGYTTAVEKNDKAFKTTFPYMAAPHSGFGVCGGVPAGTVFPANDLRNQTTPATSVGKLGIATPEAMVRVSQNPFVSETTLTYHIADDAQVTIAIYDLSGKMVKVLEDQNLSGGTYEIKWKANGLPNGTYLARVLVDGKPVQTVKLTKAE